MDATIRELIHRGVPRVAGEVESLLKASIRLTTQRVDESSFPPGVSRLGGSPDLPPGIEWPEWKDKPLAFIAQLRLPDVTEYDREGVLPRSGTLYFFYNAEQETWGFDPGDRGSWRVLYADVDPSNLIRTIAPSDMSEDGLFPSCKFAFSNVPTLPPYMSTEIESLSLTEEENETYYDLLESVKALYGEEDSPIHRVLGYPDEIQGDMQLECQLVSHGLYCGDPEGYKDPRASSLKAGAADWRLLLQIDSDDNADMMWGDSGRIYYWIREEELRARSFDNVWMVLQCY